MCKPASFVLTRTKVFWSVTSDDHEHIIKEHDLGHLDRDYSNPGLVRVEITPPGFDFSLPPEQWVYQVDQDTLPDWYAQDAEKRARIALAKWIPAKVLLDGEHTVSNGQKYAYGSASVEAYDSASVEASGRATIIKWGSSASAELKEPKAVLIDRSGEEVVCYVGSES